MRRVSSIEQLAEAGGSSRAPPEPLAYELIELFFFAYRDFVGAPDRVLAEYGLGRAHHRVLHFVARRPDLTIADLLDTLKITKQSLNRVLKQLIEAGFISQRAGPADRRQRLLRATESGRDLALRLARLQTARLSRALEGCADADERTAISRFLFGMVDPAERAKVRRTVGGATIPA